MLLVLKIYNVVVYKYMLLQIMHFTAYNTARLQAHFSKYLSIHAPSAQARQKYMCVTLCINRCNPGPTFLRALFC